MKQWKRWMCVAMVGMAMACGDYDDDTKVSELEEQDVTDLCSEICTGESWELKCMSNGVEVTYKNKNKGDCNSACVSIKGVKDSCGVTVGDLRTSLEKPADCAEAEAGIAVALQLAACF